MIQNIAYFILALIGLGFLIFIHELGHYFVARRSKMTVEVFSIGFGKALFKWRWHDVSWQIGIIPFGGYVRIKGMERKEGVDDLYSIPDGYYGKGPWKRIMVALMGPLVNLAFAVLAFSVIWSSGGRDKPFAEKTGLIGWVDPTSQLYELGVRPGDDLIHLNKRPFDGFEDLLYAAVLDGKDSVIQGYKIDYYKGSREEFDYTLPTYPHPSGKKQNVVTMGILSPARYLIYDFFPGGMANPLIEGSPMRESGVQYKDRIIWADGSLIFSKDQLIHTVNKSISLLTVQRGEKRFVTVVPRLKISDFHLASTERGEIDDWRYEANLNGKLEDLYFIPYSLNSKGVVEASISFLGKDAEVHQHEKKERAQYDTPLQKGDTIIAVDGKPITSSFEILSRLQKRHVQLIVQHEEKWPVRSWKTGDDEFLSSVDWTDFEKMVSSIGTQGQIKENGNLRLLNPVVPKTLMEFDISPKKKEVLINEWESQKKEIAAIKDPKEKERALMILERDQKKLFLGIQLRDAIVIYNPNPFVMSYRVFEQMGRTLIGLFSGSLSPKQLSGPVGIIQVIHYGWTVGFKEALYWLGLISLNLGVLNLLPLPVLDGGHICFSLYEVITKKKVNHKVVEKIIIPFFILIVIFFIYMMYSDISRLLA